MAVNWTKLWAPSDDGTVLRGVDIRNIQNDISSTGLTDADSIQGKNVAAPTAADDGHAMYWDNSADRYDYEAVEVLMKGNLGTIADDTPNQGDIIYDNGTDFQRLTPGTAGQALQTNGAGANPSWETFLTAADRGATSFFNESGETQNNTVSWVDYSITGISYSVYQFYKRGETEAKFEWEGKTVDISGGRTTNQRARVGAVTGASKSCTASFQAFTDTLDISGEADDTWIEVAIQVIGGGTTGVSTDIQTVKIAVY